MVTERPASSGAIVGAYLVAYLVASLLALAGCGGGGGGSPAVSFSFANGSATMLESDGPTDVTVVLHTSLPVTAQDVTVQVTDAGSGTATSRGLRGLARRD
jgi:hypothetical protein